MMEDPAPFTPTQPVPQDRGRPPAILPPRFADWFAGRGWRIRDHQAALLDVMAAGRSALLIAPTGGGKTLAGFLPSLVALSRRDGRAKAGTAPRRLHTLYLSPLKALAVDVARNLEDPVREMALDITIETRSGDTKASKRQRQFVNPPDILLTTPEQLALMVAYRDSRRFFAALDTVIIDEFHALRGSKRGDLMMLGLARLVRLAPGLRIIGLSATVADPDAARQALVPGGEAVLVRGADGVLPEVTVHDSGARIPWAGHSTRHALAEVLAAIAKARTALVFVNTRSQAEFVFQTLWRLNDDNLPIALHHGSLAPEQRRKVEAAMVAGKLRAVVCTSTLDLGIDWGDVDLVVQLGAPKGIARTLQRIGRANHRLDEPSRAILVPSNRFEVLECEAAVEAVAERALDGEEPPPGGLDVLAQHLQGLGCAEPFTADAAFAEVRSAAPYRDLPRETFDRVLDFVTTGGYALKAYPQYHRLRRNRDGLYRIATPTAARQYRMNVGTIIEAPMLKVRLGRGRVLGEIEEGFIEQLAIGDTFLFAGEVLRFEGLRELSAIVSRSRSEDPKIPSYMGGKFPLSTFLAERVRRMIAEPGQHRGLPKQVAEWLRIQAWRSILPRAGELLVETFPRGRKHYMVAYPFEGRLAHQTLGMLLTRRMERAGFQPLGFVASEYALAVWSLREPHDIPALFDEDMLGDDLEAWLAESSLMKRTFRNVALIAGLIERRHPGAEKSGRQLTVSSDLIYDVLRSHEPDHVLLEATRADAARGLLDIARLAEMLRRIRGHIVTRRLDRVSPLAVPVMLEIGREPVHGAAQDALIDEVADDLIAEATRLL
ncbi:ligase-associated DNA damage response DEXH box helicase [Oceanibacterium hippocampi]|nr:ligase-associated DNA damage response DEXH box helicase [Oceanibacterium hippocampi]